MLKEHVEGLMRRRYAYPLLLSAAIVILIVNEATYQHSMKTLGGGIALTDARISAARGLQLITDAESAQRAYILTGRENYLTNYQAALTELPRELAPTLRFVDGDQGKGGVGDGALSRLIDTRLNELVTPIALFRQGKRDEALAAVENDASRNSMERLRNAFAQALTRGAVVQQQARVSLYDALGLNRWVVMVLTLTGAAAGYVFVRQLRANDDERERRKLGLEAEVRSRTDELRQLAGHLETAREDERAHVARELHDELGALLTAVKLDLMRLRRVPELPSPALERVASVERRVDEGIALKRRIIEDLRPSALDQLGLRDSLILLCNDAAAGLGVPVVTEIEPLKLAHDVELTIFRLVQESLTNVRKYAEAHRVTVSLQRLGSDGQALVSAAVQDDGVGFDPAVKGVGRHGLAGMRYRVESHGGQMSVTSTPGRGTRVHAELPWSPEPAAAEPADQTAG